MNKSPLVLSVSLPVSDDVFGRWLDKNGGVVHTSCALGQYTVTVEWRRVHSYSDEHGRCSEEWAISRHGVDFVETFRAAVTAAMARAT